MKSNKKAPTDRTKHDHDASLFHEAMQGVKPLATPDKVIHARKDLPPASQTIAQHERLIPEDTLSDHISLEIVDGEEWSFLSPGVSRQTLRRLRRGHWGIQARLDLHGFNRDEARLELISFLDDCRDKGLRSVCIIHGKGLSSKNQMPVLKTRIGNWLAQRNDVLAFCQARPEDGGGGAVMVLLRATT
ncbi:MAG: Smr/MutS family endonuclease [Nitrosomonas sp.]|nr:Smr/MutS family endonuclease [Nitrosomonas sp.]